ncbi:iron-containing alcohol dehydrogenase [Paenibacillus tarimensis]
MNMNPYSFQTAGKIIAGRGTFGQTAVSIGERLAVRSVLIVSQPSMEAQGYLPRLRTQLRQQGIDVTVSLDVKPEPTIQNIEAVHAEFERLPVDAVIGFGGGSVLDAAKVLAVRRTNPIPVEDMLGIERVQRPGVPTVLIPTTSGTGSEVTPNAIVTLPEEELKAGIISRHLLPELVIIDPVLTIGLPKPITAATGMDAFTHALESYISNKANPLSDMFALESIRNISASIVRAYHHGEDIGAREGMLLGSMYGGMALTCAGTAAVHAMAYPIGGKFNVPHGVANSMLLPHVMAFNLDAVADRLESVAAAMGIASETGNRIRKAERVLEQIRQWTKELEIPQDLRVYNVCEEHVAGLADAASKVTRLMDNNPKPMRIPDIETIYRKLL